MVLLWGPCASRAHELATVCAQFFGTVYVLIDPCYVASHPPLRWRQPTLALEELLLHFLLWFFCYMLQVFEASTSSDVGWASCWGRLSLSIISISVSVMVFRSHLLIPSMPNSKIPSRSLLIPRPSLELRDAPPPPARSQRPPRVSPVDVVVHLC